MTVTNHLIAIYDFEFFPYALGDVLTWNIRTAMRCEELGKDKVDIYICADERYPASIYQRGLINPDNFELFFNELQGAFTTNPKLGNFYIFSKREQMLEQLQKLNSKDEGNIEALQDYLTILQHNETKSVSNKIFSVFEKKIQANPLVRGVIKRIIPKTVKKTVFDNFSHETMLNNFFIKYIYSHERINQYAEKYGNIPLLYPALGCSPDIDEITSRLWKGKKIVTFHLRMRRLDVGYGGDHTYPRDSDFLEWYNFLREANVKYPNVQFVALGRLQEKPLEILRLPNVSSLRVYGMGLGHELTLMLRSDLFIGTSSGFAALANFSTIPYFITRMNEGSCKAYDIPYGQDHLPLATENQQLIYKSETSQLLMQLLVTGLELGEGSERSDSSLIAEPQELDIKNWLKLHANPSNPSRTTCRFYYDEKYRHEETAYLMLPYFELARHAFVSNEYEKSTVTLNKIKQNFPDMCRQFAPYLVLKGSIAVEENDLNALKDCIGNLSSLVLDESLSQTLQMFKAYFTNSVTNKESEFVAKLKQQIEQFNFTEVV